MFCLPLAMMAKPRELDSDRACTTANAGNPSNLYGPHFLHFSNEKAGTLGSFQLVQKLKLTDGVK